MTMLADLTFGLGTLDILSYVMLFDLYDDVNKYSL